MIDPVERKCAFCDERFVSSRDDATYCSPACRTGAYRARMSAPLPVLDVPAFMRAGRLAVSVDSFAIHVGGLGVIGMAKCVVATEALESGGLSKMPIEIFGAGSPVFVGDLESLERDVDRGQTTIALASPARRLERLQVCLGMSWGSLPPLEFARQVAAAGRLRLVTDEEAPPPVGSVASCVRDDGDGSLPLDSNTVSAWRVLEFLAQNSAWHLRVDGSELYFGPRPAPAASRVLAARGVRVFSHQKYCNDFAVVLRSRQTPRAYQMGRVGPSVEIVANRSAADIAAGSLVYMFGVHNMPAVTVDREAKRLAEEIGDAWVTVIGECDFDPTLAPGRAVTINGVDEVLHVATLEHHYAHGATRTTFRADYVPPPPRLDGSIPIAPVSPVAAGARAA